MKCDFHLHSSFSADGKASIADMCQGAKEAGADWICFTEHMDLGDPYAADRFTIHEPEAYRDAIFEAQGRFPGLRISLGAEVASSKASADAEKALLSKLPLDFFLLSCHLSCGRDPSWRPGYMGKTRREKVEGYFLAIHEAVFAHDSFDSLAHIGYVYRYLNKFRLYAPGERDFASADSADILDAILRRVAEKGASLEINTSTLGEYGFTMPEADVFKRFVYFGGESATFASDAHRPEEILRGYDVAIQLLSDCGIRYIAAYEGRKASYSKV